MKWNKRLKRIAGLAPEKKDWFYYKNRNEQNLYGKK